MKKELFSDIKAIQAEISDLLLAVADQQDWQPTADAWSFRYTAAHLATVDKDCHLHRVTRIAAGLEPHFDYYLNGGWNFSYLDLKHSLKEWAVIRQVIIDFVDALPEEALSLTGTHVTFGTMTVLDVLKQMLEHDKEHLYELRELVTQRHHTK